MCREQGHITIATVCDHVDRHRGNETKFWAGPFQSLCETHHNSTKQREEKLGVKIGVGPDGFPLVDPVSRSAIENWSIEAIERRMPSDLKPSAIPLTIVCGPPGSGKSTYIREHAKQGDTIIDLDAIMGTLSGKPEHQN
jgi:hypothetical protein